MRPEWQELWSRDPAATPFGSPDWLIPWWLNLGRGKLSVLVLRQHGRLVGLMPLAEQRLAPSAPRLAMLGEGNSDYLDASFEKGLEQQSLEAILGWIGDAGWDRFEATDLRPSSPLLSVRPSAGWHAETVPHTVCPVLKLPAGGADLNTVLPSAQRRNIRYYRAQAQESGLRIESATEESFPGFFAEFVQLHGARWAEHGQPGVLAEAKVQKFHFEAASAFLREKILRLYVLSLAKKIAAAIYLFVHRRRAYCYLAGFDPEFKAFSPGTLLIAHTIEQAFAEGCEAVDFLRGNERYKYRWGAADCPTYRRVFAKKEI